MYGRHRNNVTMRRIQFAKFIGSLSEVQSKLGQTLLEVRMKFVRSFTYLDKGLHEVRPKFESKFHVLRERLAQSLLKVFAKFTSKW